jgi:hypothetical protein
MEREPLVSIKGTVTEKVAAASSRQPGKVKLSNGQFLYAYPDKLRQIQPGSAYDFGCARSEYKGVNENTIRTFRPIDAVGPAPANFLSREEIEAQRQPRAAQAVPTNLRGEYSAPITVNKPQEPKAAPAGNQYYRPTAPRDARRMFWTATLGHFIETGRIQCTAQAIAEASTEILTAYDAMIRAEGN